MRRRSDFHLYSYGYYGYFCKLCRKADLRFSSYRDLRRHQFEEPDACLSRHLEPELVEDPDPPFEGDRIPLPTIVPEPGTLAEHRDANGRLRVFGTLHGYRAWAVGREDGQFRLFPFFAKREGSAPYERGVTTACCDVEEQEGGPHRSPDAGCSCGIYAFWSEPDAAAYRSNMRHATVLGRVHAWGKVLPGEKGFRSEFAMIASLLTPTCMAPRCAAMSTRFVTRPRWTAWMTPGGRTYPRVNDPRHADYRDTADFAASINGSQYLGWYCDDHGSAELVPPEREWFTCNFPSPRSRHRCARPSTFTLIGVPYSWCHEHAPLVFGVAEVMSGLSRFYDVDTVAPESLAGTGFLQS